MGNHMLDVGLAGDARERRRPPMTGSFWPRPTKAAINWRPAGNLATAHQLADRVYVYYNNQDLALAFSKLEHPGFEVRLGVDGPPNKDELQGQNFTSSTHRPPAWAMPENPYDSNGISTTG